MRFSEYAACESSNAADNIFNCYQLETPISTLDICLFIQRNLNANFEGVFNEVKDFKID